jgi:hypothetical protein
MSSQRATFLNMLFCCCFVKRKQCPLCSTDFKSKDLVALRGGGTGFAGSGNQVWAKKAGLAFQS